MKSRSFEDAIFIVWGPPGHGPRSQVFAREIGIEQPYFIQSTLKRGWWVAPFKYLTQSIKTIQVLLDKKPSLVFVQSPPSLAAWVIFFYSLITGCEYIIDAHSTAMLSPIWTSPKWFNRLVARRALTTIVTNEHFQKKIRLWGANSLVIRDIPTNFVKGHYSMLNGPFNVTVVNSFGPDEPLTEVLSAAHNLPDIHFYITGRIRESHQNLVTTSPENVTFTNFLPNEQYYALLASSQAVLCLTTRDHTMQRGACEALWLGKPLITSNWPLLREYFYQGTVHIDNTAEDIQAGIHQIRADLKFYEKEIVDMQTSRRKEWLTKKAELINLVHHQDNPSMRENVKVSEDRH